jgi:MerR family transcriptional regulator, light-induced transcriptional regulator
VIVDMPSPAMLRIGELSRRVGVSEYVLRAWERRYGLLRPARSAGGFRLYSHADVNRVRRMRELLAQGLSAAEAARTTLAEPDGQFDRQPDERSVPTLSAALDHFDEPAAQAELDRLLSTLTVESVIRDVLMPYLRGLGERWERGEVSTAQEHFASHVIRGRLAALARGWGHGHGPRALLACPPGERHDLPLLAFGIVLNRNGWRIDYLGADTPLDDLTAVAAGTRPDLVVLAATVPVHFEAAVEDLARLAGTVPLAIAGAGATRTLADEIGARLLTDDPVTAAERLPHRQPRPVPRPPVRRPPASRG